MLVSILQSTANSNIFLHSFFFYNCSLTYLLSICFHAQKLACHVFTAHLSKDSRLFTLHLLTTRQNKITQMTNCKKAV